MQEIICLLVLFKLHLELIARLPFHLKDSGVTDRGSRYGEDFATFLIGKNEAAFVIVGQLSRDNFHCPPG